MAKTYYDNMRNDVLRLIPDGNHQAIIEIGGGEFRTLLKLAEKYDSETWGVDIFRNKGASIDRFIEGSIEEDKTREKIPDRYFDIVMANDVLEHPEHTESFFHMAYEKLKDDGLLVISVPNARQIRMIYHLVIKGSFPRHEAGLFDGTHLRWFCKNNVLTVSDPLFDLIEHKSVGRLVPNLISRSIIGEFLGLQNLFVMKKRNL